ncbi:MAG: ATP-binding cassette domain-containing protein [Bacteroidaceae bacterium]|nr:ATP-binding cassette domain-containing protein [Bacteroidaceae bacterium]
MLRIEHLGIHFGQTDILKDVNLHVGKGELICLTGPSGCGKTTLLRAIMGFVSSYQGSIVVDNVPLSARTIESIRQRIGWMPQGLSLPIEWVSEMVRLPFDLRINKGVHYSEEKLLTYFDQLGLERGVLSKRIHEISGGQCQRILLAITALQEKPLLIIDEPTSALDSASSLRALQFVQQLAREEGRTILVVSHDKQFMEGCDKVMTLQSINN